jgi:hypothetical protein
VRKFHNATNRSIKIAIMVSGNYIDIDEFTNKNANERMQLELRFSKNTIVSWPKLKLHIKFRQILFYNSPLYFHKIT